MAQTTPAAPTQPAALGWHTQTEAAVLEKLSTDRVRGLTSEEAKRRLDTYGHNELREKPPTPFWRLVVDQLTEFVVLLLIGASIISFILEPDQPTEAIAIIAIVILNTVIGVIQESRAEASLAALKKLAAPDSRVIRDGSRINVPSRVLVPGDLVLLESGNFVPADLRLIEAVNLRVEEAALTGESVPVEKRAGLVLDHDIPLGDQRNAAFMGTVVAHGRGLGVVVATGHHTQIGMIADMLASVEEEETPLQKRLDELGKQLSIAAIIIVAIVFVVALINQTNLALLFSDPLTYLGDYEDAIRETFIIAVSLAIAAVPEGLPAVVTITLALGMREMVKRHALIRRLASVETLGSASVICSDKTGTLTQNEMTAVRLWCDGEEFEITGDGYRPEGKFVHKGGNLDFSTHSVVSTTLWTGLLANDAVLEKSGEADGRPTYRMVGDPTEGALVVAAAKAGLWRDLMESAFPRVAENPFDSARKTMSTLHQAEASVPADPFRDASQAPPYVLLVKGAPDVVLASCTQLQTLNDEPVPLTPAKREEIAQANALFSGQALRVLAVAYRSFDQPPDPMTAEAVERELTFVGLIGLIDPPRAEVKTAIQHAREAGIRTVMITGDYIDTARAIARNIGLLRPEGKVLPGAALDKMNDAELLKTVQETDVFARVSPQHKMTIVDALQRTQAVVAMTGDGVNDAPALKKADIGVAMGIAGTDVAKEAAHMVLTDDNYASIVSAVEQGRIIYSNIRKFVFFLLSSNVAEIMIIFLATLAGMPTPLTAIQLLWLNLITDGAPALALAMEKGDPDVMAHPPRPKNEPIVNGSMRLGIVIQTIAQTTAVLGAFILGLLWHLEAGAEVPAGENPFLYLLRRDWTGVDVQTAETMAFVTLSLCELFRAYTVRSERASLFTIGVFSNRYMQYAVGLSLILLLLVVNVPFLQPVFNTHFLNPTEWGVIFGLALIPAVAEELTKAYLRARERAA
jgi:P-type Ca2+ transporter type 2C